MKKRNVFFSTLLCTAMLLSISTPPALAASTEDALPAIDALSSATGGGGATVPPSRDQYEDEPGVPISQADKALPYDGDFVQGYTYDNKYGFVLVSIDPDMLSGGFVNGITHIGINDMKYTHQTVNKDKSHWYNLFIPYKYLNAGENDLYFYLDDITYKVRFKTDTSNFEKKGVPPVLIPEPVVSGENELMKFDIRHDDQRALSAWQEAFQSSHIRVSEIFTMGGLETEINPNKYSVALDKTNNTLNIQFNNYDINKLYVYRVEVSVPGYTTTYRDVILHEAAPELKAEWQTGGNYSCRITVKNDDISVYPLQISKVILIDEDREETVLNKKRYSTKLGALEISRDVFESNKTYTVVLQHSSIVDNKIAIQAPTFPEEINKVVVLVGDMKRADLKKNIPVVISHSNGDWIRNITTITAYNCNGTPTVVTDYEAVAAEGKITIPAANFAGWDGMWSIKITATGYEDVLTYLFVEEQDPFPPVTPLKVTGHWDADHSYLIQDSKDPYNTDIKNNLRAVFLIDKTTNEIKELKQNKDYESSYTIKIGPSAFTSEHEYEIRVMTSYKNTCALTTTAPVFSFTMVPWATVPNVQQNSDVIISSDDADWISAVMSIELRDQNGHQAEDMSFTKEDGAIRIPASVIGESRKIVHKIGDFSIRITAPGYEHYTDNFTVTKGNIVMTQSFMGGNVKLSFSAENLPDYGFGEQISKVTLNGRDLSKTEYRINATGTFIYVSEKLLIDGENVINVVSSRDGQFETTFSYENTALAALNTQIESLINNSNLDQARKLEHLSNLNSSGTVKAATAVKVLVEKEIHGLPSGGNNGSGNNGGTGGTSSKGHRSGGAGSSSPTTLPTPAAPDKPAKLPVVDTNSPEKMTDTVGHWGKESIDYVVSRGLFTGTSEYTFSPGMQMTRSMVWTVLARLDGQSTTGGDAWYSAAQTWATAKDISDGTLPQDNVTREQLISILYRYTGSPAANRDLSSFADANQISSWASPAMQWAVETGLVIGANNNLNPQGDATRAEVSAIFMRYIQLVTK